MDACFGIGFLLFLICAILGLFAEFVTRMLPDGHPLSACAIWDGVDNCVPPLTFLFSLLAGIIAFLWVFSLPILVIVAVLYLAAKKVAKIIQNYSIQKIVGDGDE